MSTDVDQRFGAPIDTADNDLWSRTRMMQAIDVLRDKAVVVQTAPAAAVEGSLGAAGNSQGFSFKLGGDLRGVADVVRLSDFVAANDVASTTAGLRDALAAARSRRCALFVDTLISPTINTSGTPLDFSSVHVFGRNQIIRDLATTAGPATWTATTTEGLGACSIRGLRLRHESASLTGLVRVAVGPGGDVAIEECELMLQTGPATTGVVQLTGSSYSSQASASVRIDRTRIIGNTGTGLAVASTAGDSPIPMTVHATGSTFVGFTDAVRVEAVARLLFRGVTFDGSSNQQTRGLHLSGYCHVGLQGCGFRDSRRAIRVSGFSPAFLELSQCEFWNSASSVTAIGSIAPQVEWADSSHGTISMRSCSFFHDGPIAVTNGVLVATVPQRSVVVSTENCRSGTAGAQFVVLGVGSQGVITQSHRNFLQLGFPSASFPSAIYQFAPANT